MGRKAVGIFSLLFFAGCGVTDAINTTSLCACDQTADDSKCIQFEPVGPTPQVADMNCSTFKMTCTTGSPMASATDNECPGGNRYAVCTIDQAGGTVTTKVWYSNGGKPRGMADNSDIENECTSENGNLTYE